MSDGTKFNKEFFDIGLNKLSKKLLDANVDKTVLHVIGGFVMLE